MINGSRPANRQVYRIRIEGALAETWSEWFAGMSIEHEESEESARSTVLSGPLDQSALHGILVRIRDLNLKLISVAVVGCSSASTEITHKNHPRGR
jgi:hypothetical protein